MADEPSSEDKDQAAGAPQPEMLKPQTDPDSSKPEEGPSAAAAAAPAAEGADKKPLLRPRHAMYRPSHKATFIGLIVVSAILAVNAGVVFFVIKSQSKHKSPADQAQVTVNQEALDKLGVNRSSIGSEGVELTVNPDARFKGKLQVGGDVSIAGQLKLNSKFSAADASLAKLDAGNTSLQQLNVNGDATASNLNLRSQLVVAGTTRLQGDVTLTRLLTVNNSANIAGNLSVGGALSVNRFQTSNITLGGHIITRGSAPRVGPGPGLGSNGTVSISGSDASGTIATNIGTGSGGGTLANVVFRTPYDSTPRVVVTAVGAGLGSVYVTRSSSGFSVGVNGAIAPGGYAFDYMVMQ